MATLGLAQQTTPSLPIEFLRKIEQLRRVNPQLLGLIERLNGFAFPSEIRSLPARRAPSPTGAAVSRAVGSTPAVRSGDPFAAIKPNMEADARPKSVVSLSRSESKPDWGLPLARVKIIGSPLGLLLRKTHFPPIGGGGPATEQPVEIELEFPVGLRITDDEMARITDDDLFRVID